MSERTNLERLPGRRHCFIERTLRRRKSLAVEVNHVVTSTVPIRD